MKGFIFSEFLELVEDRFGYHFVDEMINETSSDGVYTSVSTYPVEELVEMVQYISNQKGISVPDLLVLFGHFLFPRFVLSFPAFFDAGESLYDFLGKLHGIIHVEVQKLYPGANTPTVTLHENVDGSATLVYTSPRKLAWFAKGMLEAAVDHYSVPLDVEMQMKNPDGSDVVFILTPGKNDE